MIQAYKELLKKMKSNDLETVIDHMENLNPYEIAFAEYWFEDKFLKRLTTSNSLDIMATLSDFFSDAKYHTKTMKLHAIETIMMPLQNRIEYLEEEKIFIGR